MNAKEALVFVEKHGVVLVSAKGPVPRLTEVIVSESIKGSWWAHPKSRQIFTVLQTVTDSENVLICRLVNGKVTLVHRRLWPALVRVAKRFPSRRIAQVIQEHTASGRHITREVPFPKWVPAAAREQAKKMSEKEALAALGTWSSKSTLLKGD
ncbi:MAG TPA: hypothetical protein VK208_21040 [Pyrinomonadaceae bacterium]|jgi:hypothetical protein|nr:hypothetical protein [Pyrinomonadaceae bacterium]